ncbi:hypothetical protein BDD12DRAFT_802151 [Trichophaea hybrida]|nr:hypothetical protein BDD12DRAFT_802151 [Trichophaea hybrida]
MPEAQNSLKLMGTAYDELSAIIVVRPDTQDMVALEGYNEGVVIEEGKEVVQMEKEAFVGSEVEKEAIYTIPGKQDPEKEAIYPTPIEPSRASGLRGYWETFMAWKYRWYFTAVVVGVKRKHDDNLASSKQIHFTGIRPDSGIATLSLGNSTTAGYQLRVYFQSHDNHIQEQIYDGTKWLDKPLSLVEGKPGSPIAAMFYPYDYDKRPVWASPEFTITVCFLNKDNELVDHVNNGTSWKAGNLGQAEKFGAANGSQLSGALLRKKQKPGFRDTFVLFYQGKDKLIHQLVHSNKFNPPRWIQNSTFQFGIGS